MSYSSCSGGGLAGVSSAIAISHFSLERKDIRISIYEAMHELNDIGAGVALWLRPWKVMKNLGLDKPLRDIVDVPESETELGSYSPSYISATRKY